jgi:hypothetical protein
MAQNIGIVFCGGCNPQYDRVEFIHSVILQAENKLSIENAKPDQTYDAILVVCGCSCACAKVDHLKTGQLIYVTPKEIAKPGFESEIVNILLRA